MVVYSLIFSHKIVLEEPQRLHCDVPGRESYPKGLYLISASFKLVSCLLFKYTAMLYNGDTLEHIGTEHL